MSIVRRIFVFQTVTGRISLSLGSTLIQLVLVLQTLPVFGWNSPSRDRFCLAHLAVVLPTADPMKTTVNCSFFRCYFFGRHSFSCSFAQWLLYSFSLTYASHTGSWRAMSSFSSPGFSDYFSGSVWELLKWWKLKDQLEYPFGWNFTSN